MPSQGCPDRVKNHSSVFFSVWARHRFSNWFPFWYKANIVPGPCIGQLANIGVFLMHMKIYQQIKTRKNPQKHAHSKYISKKNSGLWYNSEHLKTSGYPLWLKMTVFILFLSKKNIKPLSYIVDTSEVLKYCRNSSSLSKLKVMRQKVDRLHLDKPWKRNLLCRCFLTHT